MKEYDIPTYPELGHIYPGDYYEALPFDEYIRKNQPLPNGKPVFDIRDFGAVAEENVLNTESIRKAMKACEEAGGGIVYVAGGSYVTGTISVPSNTTLFIAPDSEILAARNVELLISDSGEAGTERGTEAVGGAFLFVKNVHDVLITGGGRISGNGEWFVYEPRELPSLTPFPVSRIPRRDQKEIINTVPDTIRYYYRQRIRYSEDKYGEGKPNLRRPAGMVWLEKSSNITFRNIILHDSMSWTMHIDCCNTVTIEDLVIDDNRHVANSDGIDVDGSENVTIRHCFISCADDGLCIKNPAHTNHVCRNIHISDCQVLSVMNAFKIGTETRHDIENITVTDCTFSMPDIYPGGVSGISLESCDGTNLRNVVIQNITMNHIVCPLYILLNKRNRYQAPILADKDAVCWGGSINNITIRNIKAENAELPSIITGYQITDPELGIIEKKIQNVILEHFDISYRKNEQILEIPDQIEEFLTDYPESNAHGDVNASGIWLRHVDHIQLKDLHFSLRDREERKKIVLYGSEDLSGISMEDIEG